MWEKKRLDVWRRSSKKGSRCTALVAAVIRAAAAPDELNLPTKAEASVVLGQGWAKGEGRPGQG